jgi:hypothetical protein
MRALALVEDAMRDLRSELQERAAMARQRIAAEEAHFESLLRQLKAERDTQLQALRAELQAVNKLINFNAWRHDVRTALLMAIAGAATAELSVRKSAETQP